MTITCLFEEAAELDGFPDSVARQLEEYRASALPDLITFASIDAALDKEEVLVAEGANWRYFRGKREPSWSFDWTRVDFDDSSMALLTACTSNAPVSSRLILTIFP